MNTCMIGVKYGLFNSTTAKSHMTTPISYDLVTPILTTFLIRHMHGQMDIYRQQLQTKLIPDTVTVISDDEKQIERDP
jgi:hypothetical protein